MTAVVLIGAVVGFGCIGIVHGFRKATPSLEVLARTMAQPLQPVDATRGPRAIPVAVGRRLLEWADPEGNASRWRWTSLRTGLAITGGSWEGLASQTVVDAGLGLLLPPLLWIGIDAGGISLQLGMVILVTLVAVPCGACLPTLRLIRAARSRRRHFRVVMGTFVDLVVLGLAGGVGIEGALFGASQVSTDWAVQRMAMSLSKARDSGHSPWLALGELGEEIGVGELVELSATLQLAGTEGARIRQSLSARSMSLRRHEQADAESDANAMTERLFLPGALLLIGFLLFVGYPAFSRILGGV